MAEKCLVDTSRPLVLGFSGGPDSLALLHALHGLGQNLIVAHFDHQLRSESAQDADKAKQVAAEYQVPFLSEASDVGVYARQRGQSLEEAARNLRYAFLFRVAAANGAAAVAVAHNADDQAETILMHLLRGAGPSGLRGMPYRLSPNPWSRDIPLVRPLLGVWRSQILAFCAAHDLHPVWDASNQDRTFFRNRLRHELLPQLEEYVPGVKQRLIQTAELLEADQEVLDALAAEAWRGCLAQRGKDYFQFDRSVFMAQPLSVQRRLLRRVAGELRPMQRDVDFEAVQHGLQLIAEPTSMGQADWLAGLFVLIEGNKVWIADWDADLPVDWPQAPEELMNLEVPGHITLNAGWHLEIESKEPLSQEKTKQANPYESWLDANNVGQGLVLRRRKPGDRFQPLGMETGSQKLSDFFINEKLSSRARDGWPLLCKGDDIVWVPGFRLAQPYRLTKSTQKALHLQLSRGKH